MPIQTINQLSGTLLVSGIYTLGDTIGSYLKIRTENSGSETMFMILLYNDSDELVGSFMPSLPCPPYCDNGQFLSVSQDVELEYIFDYMELQQVLDGSSEFSLIRYTNGQHSYGFIKNSDISNGYIEVLVAQ